MNDLLKRIYEIESILKPAVSIAKCTIAELPDKIQKILDRIEYLEKELKRLKNIP